MSKNPYNEKNATSGVKMTKKKKYKFEDENDKNLSEQYSFKGENNKKIQLQKWKWQKKNVQ